MSAPEVFDAWRTAWEAEVSHALKPGEYVAAFGGARMWHRMGRGIETAGFEIRDQIAWLHTTGMPKSMDLAHVIDKNYPQQPAPARSSVNPLPADHHEVDAAARVQPGGRAHPVSYCAAEMVRALSGVTND